MHVEEPSSKLHQVIGDLWESYLKMLDEGEKDGYNTLNIQIDHSAYGQVAMRWTSLGANATAAVA